MVNRGAEEVLFYVVLLSVGWELSLDSCRCSLYAGLLAKVLD